MERSVVLTRFSCWSAVAIGVEKTPGDFLVGIVAVRRRDMVPFIEATRRSAGPTMLSALVSDTAWPPGNSGACATRDATCRASGGAWPGTERP